MAAMAVIPAEIASIVARVLEVPSTIDPDADFVADLAIDSLHLLELVVALEERLGIAYEPQDVDAMRSLRTVIRITGDRVMRAR